MIIQRNNLIQLLRLVIKGLFKHRSKVLTPECRIYFGHLFVLLEKCLAHGLKRNCFWQINLKDASITAVYPYRAQANV